VGINGNQSRALAAAVIDRCERPLGHNHQPIVFEAPFLPAGFNTGAISC